MFKKHAFRLAIWLLLTPLAVAADPAVNEPKPIQLLLEQGSMRCEVLPEDLDQPALERLLAFYRAQAFMPVWRSYQQLDELVQQLHALADDGLDPGTYQPATIHRLSQTSTADPQHRNCSDIFASHAYLQALQHLAHGRLDQQQLEPVWRSSTVPAAKQQEQLLAIAQAGLDDPASAFQQARPSLPQYRNLRSAYSRLRKEPLPTWQSIPPGQTLRPGMSDARVPLLRQRLASAGYLAQSAGSEPDNRYRPPLVAALKAYQRRHGLDDDGIVGHNTLAALNISPASRLDQLRINLERFRWLARDIEPQSMLVDIAGSRLIYLHDHEPQWQTRVQVGTASRPTPPIKSMINRLTLNPTWTIPPTIRRLDKLPRIREDIGYLAQHQISVLDYQGNPLDPHSVDWDNPRGILLRQAAGPENPLGKVAIRFANPFSVYLHDTPSQYLFDEFPRTFSSGCVRVESPMQMIDLLLSDDAERKRMLSLLERGDTHEFRLARPTPILMAYWTAEADEAGEPIYRPDIYAQDAALLAALNAAQP